MLESGIVRRVIFFLGAMDSERNMSEIEKCKRLQEAQSTIESLSARELF